MESRVAEREAQQGLVRVARSPSATRSEAVDTARRWIEHGYALLLSPGHCRLERLGSLRADELTGPDAPYELRLFGDKGEVRWVEGSGAVAVGEDAPGPEGWRSAEPSAVLILERSYVLAATVYELAVDVGAPAVSAQEGSPPRELLAVTAREYLGEVDAFGNVGLLGERLVGIEAVPTGSWPRPLAIPAGWGPRQRAETER